MPRCFWHLPCAHLQILRLGAEDTAAPRLLSPGSLPFWDLLRGTPHHLCLPSRGPPRLACPPGRPELPHQMVLDAGPKGWDERPPAWMSA